MNALKQNSDAVNMVAAAVESTLGPKGLDTMLVGEHDEVLVTNDGVTILDKMEMHHPAARMISHVAKAQQQEMGDGTTTSTILAAAIVDEGVKQAMRGVPIIKVIEGVRRGVRFALNKMKEKAQPIYSLDDDWLQRIAFTASRENEDITLSVIEAVHLLGREKLLESGFKLSDTVLAHPQTESNVVAGLLIDRSELSAHVPTLGDEIRVLTLADNLEPEYIEELAKGTDAGFAKQEQLKEEFYVALEHLIHLQVGLIVTSGHVDPHAEEVLMDAGMMIIQRVNANDLKKLSEHTGSRLMKKSGLFKPLEELEKTLGQCQEVEDVDFLNRVRVSGGAGKPFATILVGAATTDTVQERERICKDAASAVQAAIRGGYVPGGGAVELSLARELEQFREKVQGSERFGVSAVVEALQRPMSQIIINAGFNVLEKVENVKTMQVKKQSSSLGIDCDRGVVADMVEMGVVDPLLVKYHALRAAGEVSCAILRIHNVVSMKKEANK
ncbi:TCP-1/cpn60 chaperonin family protein [Hazenella sp. IB182357]|uniref:TCP-1/cpn60 chaperonin family protein n=2 Tax=Polycladospora coralii TaxID=2771432 RepID=A0A926N937_9BACL|nr:TCP-1/cpn60 chaperonin family protein [Polycladospora coralii]MBS7530082.1 TCP-1/cpn60 chaperonin family protein [Polycladospora coralii]